MVSDRIPDHVVIRRNFRRRFGRPLDLANPTTFSEKLCWLMINNRSPTLTQCADKYAVRDYVKERAGGEILNELYGVWDQPDDVDFRALPTSFVLKVTWGWAMNLFCRDKSVLDVPAARTQLRSWMRRNHYWTAREWPYKNIRARIIAERFLQSEDASPPKDYKIYCFNGTPRMIQVDSDRFTHHTRDMFDLNWQPYPFTYVHPRCPETIPRPRNLDQMLDIARKLSLGMVFVRIDLYSVKGQTVFGEMAWYPEGANGLFDPARYDRVIGDWLVLPI